MQVTLAPDLEHQVAKAVAAGRFANPSDAVAQALRLLFATAEAEMPSWLRIGDTADDTVPAVVAAALDRSTEDLRLGRVQDVGVFLTRTDAKIAAYFSRPSGNST